MAKDNLPKLSARSERQMKHFAYAMAGFVALNSIFIVGLERTPWWGSLVLLVALAVSAPYCIKGRRAVTYLVYESIWMFTSFGCLGVIIGGLPFLDVSPEQPGKWVVLPFWFYSVGTFGVVGSCVALLWTWTIPRWNYGYEINMKNKIHVDKGTFHLWGNWYVPPEKSDRFAPILWVFAPIAPALGSSYKAFSGYGQALFFGISGFLLLLLATFLLVQGLYTTYKILLIERVHDCKLWIV